MNEQSRFNELAPGRFGRHAMLAGSWSPSMARFVDEGGFPMLTMDGRWGDCGFFSRHGVPTRWLHLANGDRRVDGLKHLPYLEWLHLGFEPRALAPLLELPALSALELHAKEPARLFEHPSLRSLEVIGARGFDGGSDGSGIESLKLVRPTMTGPDTLPRLQCLQALSIYGAAAMDSLRGLERFPRLEVLMLESCRRLSDIDGLSRVPSLRRLRIAQCPLPALPDLGGLEALEVLHVGGMAVRVNWDSLFALPALSEVAVLVPAVDAEVAGIEAAASRHGRRLGAFSAVGAKARIVSLTLERDAR